MTFYHGQLRNKNLSRKLEGDMMNLQVACMKTFFTVEIKYLSEILCSLGLHVHKKDLINV